ncbi:MULTISPECIES: LuxR C-terminal-related transcriptional regulator [Gordonia]|nr:MULTISPECIES: LuxR C-terminal-related transcriptional regulator [Gordonia]WLP89707.1 LuxR C-terminal-related transcriptional regulator [Gordonia sp. NB41Y]
MTTASTDIPVSPARVPGRALPQSRQPMRQPVTRIADYRRPHYERPIPGRPVAPGVERQQPVVPTAPPLRKPKLSRREVEVLMAWLAADSKEEAAEALFIAASTVSTHLARIRAKYTAVGRPAPTKTHLLARALQDGITRLEDW